MTKFYIREWAGLTGNAGGGAAVPAGFVKQQTVLDTSGGVQTSAAFDQNTRIVEWSTDGICSWALLQNGETGRAATTNDQRYPANASGLVAVSPGEKISVITNT